MKKILLIIACVFISGLALAQGPKGLSVTAGYANENNYYFENCYLKGDDFTREYYEKYHGAFVQVGYELSISKHLAITSGIRYTDVSIKPQLCPGILPPDWSGGAWRYSARRSYLSIPFKFQASVDILNNMSLFLNAGPMVHCWLSYYETSYETYSPTTRSLFKKSTTDPYDHTHECFNRLNILLGVEAGFLLFRHIKIGVGYDMFLLNTHTDHYRFDTIKNHTDKTSMFTVSAGYVF